MSALVFVPIGIVAAIMTNSWALAMTCIGGGAAMLMMPKLAKPDVPVDLRQVCPYSPNAIPEGCLAYTC